MKLRILLTSIFSIAAVGCQAPEAMNGAVSESGKMLTLTTTPLMLTGETASQTANGYWLSVQDEGDIKISNQSEQTIDARGISAEFISSRSDEEGEFFVSLDSNKNRLITYRVKNNSIADIRYGEPLTYSVEGLCLYQPSQQELNVFLLAEDQIAHQLLLSDKSKNGISQQEIRHFPLPPKAEYCVVDDVTDQLFVSEETVGVWAYNARSESQITRIAVDLVTPWGNLVKSSGPLAISQGSLFIAEKDGPYLHSYSIDNIGAHSNQQWQFSSPLYSDTFTISDKQGISLLTLSDDISKNLFTAELMLTPRSNQSNAIMQVAASAETDPMDDNGDAADDPAIWVNLRNPEQSRILGTNKKFGLYSYDLQGKKLQELVVGRVNNVDVRQGFTFKGEAADIAAASQRDRNTIALFRINPNSGEMVTTNEIDTNLDEIYGLCMYKNLNNEFYIFINDQDGRFEQYSVTDDPSGWQAQRVRTFSVNSQPEGCAADDAKQRLFVGEEDVAVWTLDAEPNASSQLELVAAVSDKLVADIEGMDIYRSANAVYLIVSSQGNDSYVVFDAEAPYEYKGRFRVGMNSAKNIDGASETDGLAVTSIPLNKDYPQGLLVVQDGRNLLPNEKQNFKYVSWQEIQSSLNL
ncbi:MAG: phytase [Thalassolituus sp.]|uniref:phytase n=1 Tax=Thalassolituus sp. TaxID=2030822 RepID=UPI003982A89F